MDEATRRMLQLRERAMELAGGEDAWDNLDDAQIDEFMGRAKREMQLQ